MRLTSARGPRRPPEKFATSRHSQHQHRSRVALLLCVGVCFVGAGCGHGFYLSESEVAAYQHQLLTAELANTDLANLQGQPVVLHFDSSGPVPHLTSTNLLEVLRGTELGLVEQLFHQIHLDRLTTQIEKDLDQFISNQLTLLVERSGSQVQIQKLDTIIVTILTAPSFTYDSATHTIAIDARLQLVIGGAINVNAVSGAEADFLSLLGSNPNGNYPLTITIDSYHLPIQLRVSNPYSNAARVTLHLAPEIQSRNITVAGGGPDKIKQGIQQLFSSALAGVVDAEQVLAYDNFALTQVSLSAGPDPSRPGSTTALLNANYIPLPHRAPPIVDVVARGADHRLHHARKRGGVWGNFSTVPFPGFVNSDPALVASENDRLELAAISAEGLFLHTAWREGRWAVTDYGTLPLDAAHPQNKFVEARPAMTATAAGQIEVVAAGSDGSLYHIRRLSGHWVAPQLIAPAQTIARPPLHDPVAVVGGSRIAVFYVDSLSHVFDVVYDTGSETWGSAHQVSTRVIQFAPAAAACGDERVDAIYVGQDGITYDSALLFTSDSISLAGPGQETNLGNTLKGPPALACSGYQQAELVGTSANNQLMHNHLVAVVGPHTPAGGGLVPFGWQGWTSADDRFFGTILFGSIDAPVELGSTRTGDVELIGRARGNWPGELYESSFDSSRVAVAPARAVNWRGLQEVGTDRFVGRPAVAISDQQLNLGVVALHDTVLPNNVRARELALWRSDFADNNMAQFQLIPGTELNPGDQPVAMVSSGPGSVDYFYLTPAGEIQNIRVRNGFPVSFPVAGSRNIASSPVAVSYGNGQLELVAVGRDNNIYHWRRLYGVWQDPVQVPTRSLSLPVLAYVGAGQLDMMAVAGDLKLRRWRFLNGMWTNEFAVQSAFQIEPLYFGPPAASSWGDGTLDIAVVERQTGKMHHARTQAAGINPDPNLYFNEIGGKTLEMPVMMALGSSNLVLFALGTDHYYYQNWAHSNSQVHNWTPVDLQRGRNLLWPGFTPLTATNVTAPSVVRLTDNDLASLIFDSRARLYYNRFSGGAWSGFAALPGQPAETRQPPIFRPTMGVQ